MKAPDLVSLASLLPGCPNVKPRERVGVGILDGAAVTGSSSLENWKGLGRACEEAILADWVVWGGPLDCWLSFPAKFAKILVGAVVDDGEVDDGNCTSGVDTTVGLEDSGADVAGAPRLPKEAGSGFVPGNLAPIMLVVEE